MKELRGLSPIVAVVMLILIAIAASVLVYVWMSGLVASTPTTEPALQERIKIEATSYNGTHLIIYVRNLGDIVSTITSAYVIIAENGTIACANTTLNVDVNPNDVKDVALSCQLGTGTAYIAKVVTKYGTEATYTFVHRG